MKKEYCTDRFKPFKLIIETEEECRYLCDVISGTLGGIKKEWVPIARGIYKLLTDDNDLPQRL